MAGIEIFSCNYDCISVNLIRLRGEKLNVYLTMNVIITDLTTGLIFMSACTKTAADGHGIQINYIQMPCENHRVT